MVDSLALANCLEQEDRDMLQVSLRGGRDGEHLAVEKSIAVQMNHTSHFLRSYKYVQSANQPCGDRRGGLDGWSWRLT